MAGRVRLKPGIPSWRFPWRSSPVQGWAYSPPGVALFRALIQVLSTRADRPCVGTQISRHGYSGFAGNRPGPPIHIQPGKVDQSPFI